MSLPPDLRGGHAESAFEEAAEVRPAYEPVALGDIANAQVARIHIGERGESAAQANGSNEGSHATVERELPPDVRLAYDGLVVQV